MDQTLPGLPGNRVSRNGPKTAHSCQSRIGRLQSGLCGRRGSEEAQVGFVPDDLTQRASGAAPNL
jgi:hypothetical protein